jgi:hypothetical protein
MVRSQIKIGIGPDRRIYPGWVQRRRRRSSYGSTSARSMHPSTASSQMGGRRQVQTRVLGKGEPHRSNSLRSAPKGLCDRYAAEQGKNRYAVLNAITNFASHPPENRHVHRDRHGLQRQAGTWLTDFGQACQRPDFAFENYLVQLTVEHRFSSCERVMLLVSTRDTGIPRDPVSQPAGDGFLRRRADLGVPGHL